MAPKHVLTSQTILYSLAGMGISAWGLAINVGFWQKTQSYAQEIGAHKAAIAIENIILPLATGATAIGTAVGRIKTGGLAFWTPDGLPGPDRDDFAKNEPDIPAEIRVVQDQNALGNQAINHLIDVVQGLQSKIEQVPVVDDIKGTIENAVKAGQQVALPPVEMGERQPDKIIDLARNKLMEMI